MPRVIGLGAGGHAKVILDILLRDSAFEIVGLLDPNSDLHGASVMGVPVLGPDEMLGQLCEEGVTHAFIGVGANPDTSLRQRLAKLIAERGLQFVTAIHDTAAVARSARLGDGVAILAQAVVNAEAVLGNHVTVNSGAVVEHDCRLGDHVQIAPHATLGGAVRVGGGSHVGLGAILLPGVTIGRQSVVGAGAVALRDVPDETTVIGVPARVLDRP